MSTEATLVRHIGAISQGLDAIMRDYSDDAVLITPDGVLRGAAGIRGFFERFLNEAPPELLPAMALVRMEAAGEVGFVLWKAEPFIPLATDTFVVRGDRIVAQTFAMLTPVPAGA